MLAKRWFADRYGWTPRQVDELSLSELELLPYIEMASREASEMISRQES